jgi:lysozyme
VTILDAVARASETVQGALRASLAAICNRKGTSMQRHSVKLLRASPEIKSFIKTFETLQLKAYDDGTGVWTIGWGHASHVSPGDVVTRTQAEDLFRQDVYTAEGVIRLGVKVPLSQHEYDALVSFIFNVGGGKFAQSTLRARLNELRYEDAADEFPKWRKGGGRVLKGLVTRRARERQCFLFGVYSIG